MFIIKVWPSAGGPNETLSTEKVPSKIAYDVETGKVTAWGAMVGNEQLRYQEFKLFLDPDRRKNKAKLEQSYPDPSSLPFTPQHSPTKCTIDYLKQILPILEADVDAKAGAGTFKNTKIEWVVTVPAIWSENARQLTAFCAEQAGMRNPPQLISEPEAAMIHAIAKMKKAKMELNIGDAFTLCDAGGGTVDLITYRIISLEPPQLEEVVGGDGDRCGSVYIDRQFKCYLEKCCGHHKHWTEKHTVAAIDYFERITKRKFEEKDEEVIVKVPKIPDIDKTNITIRKNKLIIPAADIRNMFQNVLEVLCYLILEQKRKAAMAQVHIAGVILVGGFSQSSYVEQYVKDKLSCHDKHMIVVRPDDAWTAVMQGALNRALPIVRDDPSRVQITSRVARRFYGITNSRLFVSGQDPDDLKYVASNNSLMHSISDLNRFYIAIDKCYYIETIHWFLKKVRYLSLPFYTTNHPIGP